MDCHASSSVDFSSAALGKTHICRRNPQCIVGAATYGGILVRSAAGAARATTLPAVSTPLGDDKPADAEDHLRRSPAEEIEWIGAEVEARPKVMFWGTVAVAAVLAIALIVFIIVVLTGN